VAPTSAVFPSSESATEYPNASLLAVSEGTRTADRLHVPPFLVKTYALPAGVIPSGLNGAPTSAVFPSEERADAAPNLPFATAPEPAFTIAFSCARDITSIPFRTVFVPVPSAFVAERVTEYTPGVTYVWTGFCIVALVVSPSPKSQFHEVGSLIDWSVNVTGRGVSPTAVSNVKSAMGGGSVVVKVTEALVPSRPSGLMTVTFQTAARLWFGTDTVNEVDVRFVAGIVILL